MEKKESGRLFHTGEKKMSDNKFYWLKLKKDFFKRHDIYVLECMENGREVVLLYIKMLVESIDHNGCLRFNENIPYTPDMLSAIFHTDPNIVNFALNILTELSLLEIDSEGTIRLTKFSDFVGCDTKAAINKRRQRNLPILKNGSKRLNGSTLITPDGKTHNVDEKRYGGHGMQALDRAFGKCELCGSTDGIVIHHNNGYSTDLEDLVCLCVSCHGKAHSNKNQGHVKITRPPYVHQMSTECTEDVGQMSIQSIDIRDKSKEIRVKSKDNKFIAPTLEEVTAYCQERNNNIDPKTFFDYYSSNDWKDSKGNPVKNWKQKLITWENHRTEARTEPSRPKYGMTQEDIDSVMEKFRRNGQ